MEVYVFISAAERSDSIVMPVKGRSDHWLAREVPSAFVGALATVSRAIGADPCVETSVRFAVFDEEASTNVPLIEIGCAESEAEMLTHRAMIADNVRHLLERHMDRTLYGLPRANHYVGAIHTGRFILATAGMGKEEDGSVSLLAAMILNLLKASEAESMAADAGNNLYRNEKRTAVPAEA